MKYGKTERISGIVILLALLAIFVPWLMSDPAPRDERPQPTFVIEQPAEVVRQDVPAPEMPSTVNTPSVPAASDSDSRSIAPIEANPRQPQTDQLTASDQEEPASPPANDPIADLVAANAERANTNSDNAATNRSSSTSAPATTQQGEWSVQVGSFGDADNAQRLSSQLSAEGFSTYQRERNNNLTTVYVGPYASSEDGEAAMSLIKQRANVQGLLVRVRD